MWPKVAVLLAVLALAGGTSALVLFRPTESDPNACGDNGCQDDESVMDEGQRSEIWQIEHYVLVLSKFWFKDLAEAIATDDRAALSGMMAEEFSGTLLDQPVQERLSTDFLEVVREKTAGRPPRRLSKTDFVTHLLEWRRKFSARPQVRIVPKLLSPKDSSDKNGIWQGRGVARLWGEMGSGRPGEVALQFQFEVLRPERASGRRWLWGMSVVQTQSMHAQRHLLRDVTRDRNIDPAELHDNWTADKKLPTPGGVYLCDFNRDGIVDMLVTDAKRFFLFQGMGDGKFQDVTSAVGLAVAPPPNGQATAGFVDIDGDGWEDVLLGDQVFRNEQGKWFINYTHKTNFRIPADATGVVLADFDRDGLVDIYVTLPGKGKARSYLDGHSGLAKGNQLWRNLGNWKFENVTAASNTTGGNRSVFSAVWLDADNDGWPDIYVPNEFGNGILLLNKRDGTFREQLIMKGPQDFGTMGIACGDVNNDGAIDLYLANMYSKTGARIIGNVKPGTYSEDIMAKMRRFVAGSQLYLNQGNTQFRPVAEDWQMNDVGWAYGPALVDLDNDGFLDVFATSGYMSFDRDKPDG